jgi:hypothetical protein
MINNEFELVDRPTIKNSRSTRVFYNNYPANGPIFLREGAKIYKGSIISSENN